MDIKAWSKYYCNRKMLTILMLGFSSGLPLALVGGTLQAWFKTSGADIVTIGFLTLITQPYTYKFLWSPFLDKYKPGWLGRRRGWILHFQLLMVILIACMAFYGPEKIFLAVPEFSITWLGFQLAIPAWNLPILFVLGLLLSFASASQDIVIDAYRVDILSADERGLGAALGVEGFRLAMLISGGLALVLADNIGWQQTYLIMSSFMGIGIIGVLLAPEPKFESNNNEPIQSMIVTSFKEFLTRDKAWFILALMVLYKLGDAFSHALSTAFLLDLQFSLSEVGIINKVVGLIASLLGVFLGGLLMTRVELFRSLLFFGVLSGIMNLIYMLLAWVGKNFIIACVGFFVESTCAGMGTAAFTALLMSMCNTKYSATQFALFSSLASFGRVYVGPVSGYLVKYLGWSGFYATTALIAVPGIVLLCWLKPQIDTREKGYYAKADHKSTKRDSAGLFTPAG